MVESFELTELPRGEVLRYMGYRGQEYAPELDGVIDRACARCLELAHAKASWLAFELASGLASDAASDAAPVTRLKGTALELPGRSIARYLEGATHAAVLAVTVGMPLERELRLAAATDPVFAVALDAAATAAVEEAADALSECIAEWAASQGLFAKGRFSPGYGDLPLEIQPKLLSALDAQRRLGITLSASLLMVPTKSVTAVTALFPQDWRPRPV